MDTEAEPKVTNLLWVLRLLVVVHFMVALAQAVSAGSFLEGELAALNLHQVMGTSVITAVAVLQVVVATICWRRQQLPVWFALVSFGLFLAEAAQIGLGFTDRIALHVPLGALIVGTTMVLLHSSFKPYDSGDTPAI